MGRHEAEQIPQWASDDSESSCTNCPTVMSLGENDPYRHPDTNAVLCDSCYIDHIESALTAAREERDRVRDALRELDRYVRLGLGAIELGITEDGNIGIWLANEEKTLCKGDTVADAIAALKPVSDRQPEGETKCQIE